MSPPTHQFKDIHRIKVRFRNSALRYVRTDTLVKALVVPDVDFFPALDEKWNFLTEEMCMTGLNFRHISFFFTGNLALSSTKYVQDVSDILMKDT